MSNVLGNLLDGQSAKLEHDVKIEVPQDALIQIALLLVAVVVLNAVLRKVLS